MSEERIVGEHKGVQIRLGGDLGFHATPDEGIDLASWTAQGLRDEIDAHVAAKRKQERDPLDLAVVTTWAKRGTVKGIHLGTHILRGFPELPSAPAIYPDVPWLVEILVEMEKARASLRRADEVIKPYKMDTSRGYGRVAPAEYDSIMERLVTDYRDRWAAAEAAAP